MCQEYIKIEGARGDIQYIYDDLATMQVFLKRTPGDNDERQQDWMRQVRELTYDIEDYVDDLRLDLSIEPRRSHKLTSLRRAWYLLTTINTRKSIAKEIRNFKILVQQINERRCGDLGKGQLTSGWENNLPRASCHAQGKQGACRHGRRHQGA